MTIRVVVGANYGDESKGKMVDYFCSASTGNSLVVRYNGGAQAGHTVVMPDGRRHVFQHIGSGSFRGCDTYLGKNFICNPLLFCKEISKFRYHSVDSKGQEPPFLVYVNPEARISTYLDMIANQLIEEIRTKRNGSCGMGIFETMVRDDCIPFRVKNNPPSYKSLLDYFKNRLSLYKGAIELAESRSLMSENLYNTWLHDYETFMSRIKVRIPNTKSYSDIIFEGAQGLALDKDNLKDFPHLTPSNTGLYGALDDIKDLKIHSEIHATYVTRTYLTRHGAGLLPGEVDSDLEDMTNCYNEFQGNFRYAPLSYSNVKSRIQNDITRSNLKSNLYVDIAISHVDQIGIISQFPDLPTIMKDFRVFYFSDGPTCDHVSTYISIDSIGSIYPPTN